MKTIRLFLVLIMSAMLFTADSYAKEKGEIILGCEQSFLTAPVQIAEHQGYFQEEGIKVTILKRDSGRAALDGMLDKKESDMVTVAETPVMFESLRRDDFVIIAEMVSSDFNVKVLGRLDKGISASENLKGKKIGITKGTTGHFFLHRFLVSSGILDSEVEIVDIRAAELTQALVEGRVDAISTWEPHIYRAEKQLGEKAVLLSGKGLFRGDFYFVPNREFLKNNPETVKKFLRAVEKGQEFIQRNREASIDLIAQSLGLERDFVATVWDDFRYELTVDQTMISTLESEARWAIRNKLTDKTEVPNYTDFIDLDALEEVRPEGVRVIR